MIQLSNKHLEIVKNILRDQLVSQAVYVFGSRAKESAKTFSDLDLCIDGESLSYSQVSALKEAFSESDLPYFVDIIEKNKISDSFYESVKADFIELVL